jgi:glycine/D-amino acid oxidase-like deaminating enzyme
MFSIPKVSPSLAFPKQSDVVVIGAGIIGVTTALELQAKGLAVAVVEKGEVAAEQSSRNWGWCRQMGRDPREIPLIKVALSEWRKLNQRLADKPGYRTCGIAYLADSDAELARYETWTSNHAKPNDLSTRLLSAKQVADLYPGSTTPWRGALYTPDDGRAEPFAAVPAMAEAFKERGGTLLTQCAARGLETKAGRVCSVVTERGTINTDTVLLAGGYWSERFLANLRVRFPQLGTISNVQRTSAIDFGHERTFAGGKFAARKRLDGGYTVAHNQFGVAELTPTNFRYLKDFLPLLKLSHAEVKFRLGQRFVEQFKLARSWRLDEVTPFEKIRVMDPLHYDGLLDDAFTALQKSFPVFESIKVEQRWAGLIDVTPDAVPVIDGIDQLPGLYLASGFSGHGFGLGPGAGKLMAEIILGDTPCVDASPYRFSRFQEGPARPTTGT